MESKFTILLYMDKNMFLHWLIHYCSIMPPWWNKSNPKNLKPWFQPFFLVRTAAHTGAVTLQEICRRFIRTENNFFVNCLKKNKYIKCTYFIPLSIFKIVSLASLPYNNVSPDCLCQIYYWRVTNHAVLQSRLMMNIWLEMRKQQHTDFGVRGLSRINKAICIGQRSALHRLCGLASHKGRMTEYISVFRQWNFSNYFLMSTGIFVWRSRFHWSKQDIQLNTWHSAFIEMNAFAECKHHGRTYLDFCNSMW